MLICGAGAGVGFGGPRWTLADLLPSFLIDPSLENTVVYAAQPVLLNGDFATWTGVDPDATPTGWSKSPSPGVAANHVESAAEGCRIVSDGTVVYVMQSPIHAVANRYVESTYVSNIGVGALAVLYGNHTTPYVLGLNNIEYFALNTSAGWKRASGVTDLTFRVDSLRNLSLAGIETHSSAGLNRLPDGRCEYAGVASWTAAGAGVSLTKEAGTPYEGTQVLRVTAGSVAGQAYQDPLSIGHRYRMRGRCRSDGTGLPRVYCGDPLAYFNGTTSTDWQEFDFETTAANTYVNLYCRTAGQFCEFDALEVIDLDDPAGSMVQSTAAKQPWTTGDGWVHYDGVADCLVSDAPASAFDFLHDGRPWSLATVGSVDNLTAEQSIVANISAAATDFGFALTTLSTGAIRLRVCNGTGAYTTLDSAINVVAVDTPKVLVASYAGTGNIRVWANGVLVIDAAPATLIAGLPSHAMAQGALGDGTTSPLGGKLGELMIRDSAMTDAERAQTLAYLANKYGVALP